VLQRSFYLFIFLAGIQNLRLNIVLGLAHWDLESLVDLLISYYVIAHFSYFYQPCLLGLVVGISSNVRRLVSLGFILVHTSLMGDSDWIIIDRFTPLCRHSLLIFEFFSRIGTVDLDHFFLLSSD